MMDTMQWVGGLVAEPEFTSSWLNLYLKQMSQANATHRARKN